MDDGRGDVRRSSTARDSLEIHSDAIEPGARVIVLDDVLATGGTARAKVELVERARRRWSSARLFVIELTFLSGREKLARLSRCARAVVTQSTYSDAAARRVDFVRRPEYT